MKLTFFDGLSIEGKKAENRVSMGHESPYLELSRLYRFVPRLE